MTDGEGVKGSFGGRWCFFGPWPEEDAACTAEPRRDCEDGGVALGLSSALGSAGAGGLAFGSSGILRVERSSSGSARTAIRRPTEIPLEPLSAYGGMLVNIKGKQALGTGPPIQKFWP